MTYAISTENKNDIYELELKKENADPFKPSFLDLSTEAHDRKFTNEFFYKSGAFPFYISRMPYLDSSVPSKLFYASINFRIPHIARTTAALINMVERANLLFM